MIPVRLILETETGTLAHVTRLPALPTLDGRTVISVGGLLFVPFEITMSGHEQVAVIHVGGYAHLTGDSLARAGWVEVESEAAP